MSGILSEFGLQARIDVGGEVKVEGKCKSKSLGRKWLEVMDGVFDVKSEGPLALGHVGELFALGSIGLAPQCNYNVHWGIDVNFVCGIRIHHTYIIS